jgi:hypothetical protein
MYSAEGWIVLGGSAGAIIQRDLNLSGSSDVAFTPHYIPGGGVKVGDEADIDFEFPIITPFLWKTGSGVLRWFRITGKCKPPTSDGSPLPENNTSCEITCPQGSPDCSSTFLATIAAQDVNDACRKLKKMRLSGPIDKIEVFSVPVFPDRPGSDDECNELIEVKVKEEKPNNNTNPPGNVIPEIIASDCEDLFLDFNVLVCAGMVVTATLVFEYEASGGLDLLGSVDVTSNQWQYTEGGIVIIHGASSVFSPQFQIYSGSGGVSTGSTIFTNFLGNFLVEGKALVEVLDLDVTFAFVPAPQASISDDVIDTTCCPAGPTAIQVGIKHNLLNIPALAQFLDTNRLTLPPLYSLTFARRLNLWYNTLHFNGISSFNQEEEWEIVTEFGCVTDINLDPSNNWKFLLTIFKFNVITKERGFIRFQTLFNPAQVCKPDGAVKFRFIFDVFNANTNPAHSDGLLFTDGMGAFKDLDFIDDPFLRFEVYVPEPKLDAGVLDYTNYVVIPREP